MQDLSSFFNEIGTGGQFALALIFIAILFFILFFILWRVAKRSKTGAYENENYIESMEIEKEQPVEPIELTFGDYAKYPTCPHCHQDLRQILLYENDEDGYFNAGDIVMAVCASCNHAISITEI